jgi:hypothetical protein
VTGRYWPDTGNGPIILKSKMRVIVNRGTMQMRTRGKRTKSKRKRMKKKRRMVRMVIGRRMMRMVSAALGGDAKQCSCMDCQKGHVSVQYRCSAVRDADWINLKSKLSHDGLSEVTLHQLHGTEASCWNRKLMHNNATIGISCDRAHDCIRTG